MFTEDLDASISKTEQSPGVSKGANNEIHSEDDLLESVATTNKMKSKGSTLFEVKADLSSIKFSTERNTISASTISNAALVKGINKMKLSGLSKVAVGMEKFKRLVN
jgi:hypothetical protein